MYHTIVLGTRAFLVAEGAQITEDIDREVERAQLSGDTIVLVAKGGEVVCLVAVADKVGTYDWESLFLDLYGK